MFEVAISGHLKRHQTTKIKYKGCSPGLRTKKNGFPDPDYPTIELKKRLLTEKTQDFKLQSICPLQSLCPLQKFLVPLHTRLSKKGRFSCVVGCPTLCTLSLAYFSLVSRPKSTTLNTNPSSVWLSDVWFGRYSDS